MRYVNVLKEDVMNFEPTSIPDVFIVELRSIGDDRGHFMETYKRREFERATGVDPEFVQDNFSFSKQKGTVRGLHFQSPPHAQGKLVDCPRGAFLDVAVDVRVGSPTYKQWVSVELSKKNNRQLWVPAGFLHGFRTLTENTEIAYKCTEYYHPASDGSVLWNDEDLAIDWGSNLEEAFLSDKDKNAQSFKDFDNPFVYKNR